MAEEKKQSIEREYVIPLRKFWLRVPEYKRSRAAVKAIKKFIAKHMKVPERNLDSVKIDTYLNNEIFFRGKRNPPAKIKVKAKKEENIVKVELSEVPEYVKFLKAKHEKRHKPSENPEEKKEEKKEEKTDKEKKEEVEKEKAVEQQNIKEAEKTAKTNKHLLKAKAESYHRMALKK